MAIETGWVGFWPESGEGKMGGFLLCLVLFMDCSAAGFGGSGLGWAGLGWVGQVGLGWVGLFFSLGTRAAFVLID